MQFWLSNCVVVGDWALRICLQIVHKGGLSEISPGLVYKPDPPTRLDLARNLVETTII